MSLTSRRRGPRDIVEEFWDEGILARCYDLSRRVTVDNFLDGFRSFLGASGRMCAATSGRRALQQALAGVAGCTDREKKSVLICSFNCRSVCDAVTQAGLLPETYDFADRTGRIDWHAIGTQLRDDHLAIVVPHLFGVPSDFRPIQRTAGDLGILVIEDCAHTVGGRIGNAVAGTLGDLAIFSFTYNKPMSLGGGGVLLINNTRLEPLLQLPEPKISVDRERDEINMFIAYLRERRSQIKPVSPLSRIRRRFLPRVATSQQCVTATGFGSLRAALAIWQLDHYAAICDRRNQNASRFSAISNWHAWHVGLNVSPAWLMQKVAPVESVDVEVISRRLQAFGLRVGTFNWPTTMDRVLSRAERPNAHYVATYGLDVPIHQEMNRREFELIGDALQRRCA
jgi:dTDP-4-amino-4,6-dideoxygalactose transaminase